MSEIRPRVTGTEIEWPLGFDVTGTGYYSFEENMHVARIINQIKKKRGPDRGFLYNGARCYNDSGWLEYSTGEEDTFIGTVAAEYAGEKIVNDEIEEYVASRDDIFGYQILKRAFVDTNSNYTSGYHINLCGDATEFDLNRHDLHDLAVGVATMSLLTGAGGIYTDQHHQTRFVLAQKPLMTRTDFDIYASNRPLIKLDNGALGDSSLFHRVEIIALDPNIAPWSTRMQLIISSLCLRSIEQHQKGRDLHLHHNQGMSSHIGDKLAWLARTVAINEHMDTIVRLADDTTISTIDMQWELLGRASQTEHTSEEAQGLIEWEAGLTDLTKPGNPYLSKKNGRYPRKRALERAIDKYDVELGDDITIGINRKWDALGPNSLASVLRTKLWHDEMPFDLIEDRINNPCPTTRAAARSKALYQIDTYQNSSVTWNMYNINNRGTVYMRDPLDTDFSKQEQEIEQRSRHSYLSVTPP